MAGLRCLPMRYYLQNRPELREGAFRGYHASLVLLRGDIQGDVACGFVWWHSRAGNGRNIYFSERGRHVLHARFGGGNPREGRAETAPPPKRRFRTPTYDTGRS